MDLDGRDRHQRDGGDTLPASFVPISQPHRVAIVDPSGDAWTAADVLAHIRTIEKAVRTHDGAPARVAFVPRSDARSAATLLGLATHATAVPLSAAGVLDTFVADLRRLGVTRLLRDADTPQGAIDAAEACSVAVIDARTFDVKPSVVDGSNVDGSNDGDVDLDRTGLLLSTSGTTSTPKSVPIRRSALVRSARSVARSLALKADDVCLSIMPLHHVHGIVAGLLAPLLSGGRVLCAGDADSDDMVAFARRHGATWTTAVPTRLVDLLRTIDQAGLGRSATARSTNERPLPALRVVRSSSSPLAADTLRQLEEVLGVPVLEAYGMTECAHQICCNPLPPGVRVPGTVGFPTGVDLAILDDAGRHRPPGAPGGVFVRGPTVTDGYENHTSTGWRTDDRGVAWFDTGDVGVVDEEGRLTLIGRAKEMIDRGGENVAPRSIDDVMCAHPHVQEALAFAVPHPTLGEDVAVAIVMADGAPFDASVLREWAFEHLRPHEVPSIVVDVETLPRSASGKPKRSEVFATVADRLRPTKTEPQGELESIVARAFETILGGPDRPGRLGRDDNFFMLGGDSLTGARLAMALHDRLVVPVDATDVFRSPTPRLLASVLEVRIDELLAALDAVDDVG